MQTINARSAPPRRSLLRAPAAAPAPAASTGPEIGDRVALPEHMFPNGRDPDAYGIKLLGNCLEPEAMEGDIAIVSPAADLVAGRFVVLHWASGGMPSIKRLFRVPPWRRHHPKSEVVPFVEFEMLNPPKRLVTTLDRLSAIHLVVGFVKPGEPLPTKRPKARRATRREDAV